MEGNIYGNPSPDMDCTISGLGESSFIEKQYMPEVPKPEKTEYECDVLVVGCGYAGLHAAVTAKKAGADVIVLDKGKPGYSGLSPFAQGASYFLDEFDDREACMEAGMKGGEYIANMKWFKLWLDESAKVVEENREFGFIEKYPTAKDSGYWDSWDPRGYRKEFLSLARQERWGGVLESYGIPVVEHTMLVDVTTTDGKISGAVALHVKSATPVIFRCKAICMCTGTGSMKPTGYPTSEDTFDGEYICYQLGLPIVGKEFDDFHQTGSYAPGNFFYNNTWEYTENINSNPISVTKDVDGYVKGKRRFLVDMRLKSVMEGLPPVDGSAMAFSFSNDQNTDNSADPRRSDFQRSKERGRDIFGAAPGMNSQLSCGVFCGWDDTDGKTGFPGLYVAGNGIYGSQINGAIFSVQTNHPTCCIMGNHAGAAAWEYAKEAEFPPQDPDQVKQIIDEIFAPSKRSRGVDPNLVIEKLRNIMVDSGVHVVKSEKALTAALMQVELIRDKMIPMLMGFTGHDLRLCLEAKHKTLSAEMKLKANLFRTESRGMHYREDYPYHNDSEWLCHVGVYKDEEGNVSCKKIDVPDEWKGDLSQPHEKRYPSMFPGEAKALGIKEEPQQAWGGKPGGAWSGKPQSEGAGKPGSWSGKPQSEGAGKPGSWSGKPQGEGAGKPGAWAGKPQDEGSGKPDAWAGKKEAE